MRKSAFDIVNILVAAASLVLFTGAGCAEAITVEVVRPAELTLPGIRTVAVGGFETVEAVDTSYREEGGRLVGTASPGNPSKDAAGRVRAGLKDALSATPHFSLIGVADFDRIMDSVALMAIARERGLRRTGADAVVFGRVWCSTIEVEGTETQKVTLEDFDYRTGKDLKKSEDRLVSFPYRLLGGVLVVEYSFVRLEPYVETVAVKTVTHSFARKTGGIVDRRERARPGYAGSYADLLADMLSTALESLSGGGAKREKIAGEDLFDLSAQLAPDMSAIVQQIARGIAEDFVSRITPTTVESGIVLAEGDLGARNLILAGAFDHAERRLLKILGDPKAKIEASERAPNLFNLGVCLEARGPEFYITAVGYYLDALAIDPENAMYAAAVGRVSRIVEETRTLREQRRLAGGSAR